MEEAISEAEEEMDTGAAPTGKTITETYSPGNARELFQDLSDEEWACGHAAFGINPEKLELHLGARRQLWAH